MILELVEEAVQAGARREQACAVLGLDARTEQRWKRRGSGDDLRSGPKSTPTNALSLQEQQELVAIANLPEHRDLSPKQLVPRLADQGRYLASESTFYRVLKANGQMRHRERAQPPTHARPRELVATRPNEVWSWDIAYLRAPLRGTFFYLYLVLDVFSRKIVGWDVNESESAAHAGELVARACQEEGVRRDQLALHQDNGAPMKCGTFLALLEALGVAASFSRPGVSDDNPFVEALFRTLKYRPSYPERPFASLEEARSFIARFVDWYNTQHLHGSIRFVTPAARHAGLDAAILARRQRVYESARKNRPERWSRSTRDWSRISSVILNPTADAAREDAA
jgi:transposase InsO family protein